MARNAALGLNPPVTETQPPAPAQTRREPERKKTHGEIAAELASAKAAASLLPQSIDAAEDIPAVDVEDSGILPSQIGIMVKGLKKNPGVVLAKSVAGALAPNAYQAFKEDRYFPGIPAGAALDAGSFIISPVKTLQLAGKAMGMSNKFANPVAKSRNHVKNVKEMAKREAGTGLLDNVVFEAIGDAMDERSRGAGEYLLSGAVGAGAGAGAGVAQAFKAREGLNQYAKYTAANTHKKKVNEGRRKSYNETDDDLETFTKLVNEKTPLTTTSELGKAAEADRINAGLNLERYLGSEEATTPMKELSLSNLQKRLVDKLDNDLSGNLTYSEKELVIQNFMDDAADMLKSINPKIAEAYRKMPREQFDEIISNVPLTIRDVNKLRQISSRKTTLVTPTKAGYVRAGNDNRNMNEYYELYRTALADMGINENDFNDIMEQMLKELPDNSNGATKLLPENIEAIQARAAEILNDRIATGKKISSLNREFAKAKANEELINSVLIQQGKGSPMESHYPFLAVNPEINPTIKNNKPLLARNTAGKFKDLSVGAMRGHEEIELNEKIEEAKADGAKLGLAGKDLDNYVASRLSIGLGLLKE